MKKRFQKKIKMLVDDHVKAENLARKTAKFSTSRTTRNVIYQECDETWGVNDGKVL